MFSFLDSRDLLARFQEKMKVSFEYPVSGPRDVALCWYPKGYIEEDEGWTNMWSDAGRLVLDQLPQMVERFRQDVKAYWNDEQYRSMLHEVASRLRAHWTEDNRESFFLISLSCSLDRQTNRLYSGVLCRLDDGHGVPRRPTSFGIPGGKALEETHLESSGCRGGEYRIRSERTPGQSEGIFLS